MAFVGNVGERQWVGVTMHLVLFSLTFWAWTFSLALGTGHEKNPKLEGTARVI